MPGDKIRLLALDGGGVRGLSSLMILRNLMNSINPESPPKPCDYFDMIGGTSTGGLIAVMLGRLRMSVDESIDAYTSLSDKVFEKKSHRIKLNGKFQGRFDAAELERAIKQILAARGLDDDVLLKDDGTSCKVFVCATSKETSSTVCLASYRSPRSDNSDLLNSTTIWQACRATSAATTFFDPIAIGPFGEEFVDGALGTNNPVYALWSEAQDVWGDQLQSKLQCLVSVGTGIPSLKPVRDDALGILATLKEIATETEKTAQQFHRDKSSLDNEGRYYRFNVDRGLEDIRLEESKKKKEIAAATRLYVGTQAVAQRMRACANNLTGREYYGPYRTVFTLQGMPVSDNFVNRPSEIEKIEQCLLPGSKSGQRRRRVFVLHGLGGIGKTQLAVDFARRHKSAFSSIFWLDGRSEERLRQSFASFADKIPDTQLPLRSALLAGEVDLEAVVKDVLGWLARPDNGDWLLIFDNVDQDHEQSDATGAYDIRKYIPGDHGSVLITTRLLRLAQLGTSARLSKVDESLARTIFNKWRGSELVMDENGMELLGLLDGLPLALAQAASYLRETEHTIAWYVSAYKHQWEYLMEMDHQSGTLVLDYQYRSVWTTWSISFDVIEKKNKDATNLLRLWAFVDNKDMCHEFLQAARDGEGHWPDWLCAIAENEVRFSDTMRLLLRYSMVESQQSTQGRYVMHPVVHRWAGASQHTEEKRDSLILAFLLVGKMVPDKSTRNYWTLYRQILPHADRCLWWISILCGDEHCFNLAVANDALHNLGYLYTNQGKLDQAEKMYQRALQGYGKALGPDHTSTLNTVNNLALLYAYQGKLDEAEKMYQRALDGYKKALGPAHTSTLGIVNNLGSLYKDQGKLDQAEEMYQRALEGYEKALGPDHTSILDTVNNLSLLFADQGKLDEAEKMYQRALQGKEKALGPDHTSTLNTVNNLGNLYTDQGKLDEAEKMYQRALEGYEKALGPDHTSTLRSVNNLGNLYADQGKPDEAEKMYQRALQGYEKALGPDHTSTLGTINNLGSLYKDQGKLDKAEKMYQRALQGKEKALGPDHTSTLHTVNNLGNLYADQGKLDEAEKMYQRALQGYEEALSSETIIRFRPALRTMVNMGDLRAARNQVEQAKEFYLRGCAGLEALLGPSHEAVKLLQDKIKRLDDSKRMDEVECNRQKEKRQSSIKRIVRLFLKMKKSTSGS